MPGIQPTLSEQVSSGATVMGDAADPPVGAALPQTHGLHLLSSQFPLNISKLLHELFLLPILEDLGGWHGGNRLRGGGEC